MQNYVEIFQPVFLAAFSWNLVSLCCILFLYQIEIVEYILQLSSHIDPHFAVFNSLFACFQLHSEFNLVLLVITSFWSLWTFGVYSNFSPIYSWSHIIILLIILGILFVICELSQRFTDACDEINDTINQLVWYSFPVALKRMLPTIMAMAQPPKTFNCIGSTPCSRDTFKKVDRERLFFTPANKQFNESDFFR